MTTVNLPVHDTFEDTPAQDRDPEWFKRAVFYEVLVRSFKDSNGHVVATSRPLHRGRTTIVVETDIHDAAGKHVARVTQTQAVLGP